MKKMDGIGLICPICSSLNIAANGIKMINHFKGEQEVTCGSCKANWKEIWELKSNNDIIINLNEYQKNKKVLN